MERHERPQLIKQVTSLVKLELHKENDGSRKVTGRRHSMQLPQLLLKGSEGAQLQSGQAHGHPGLQYQYRRLADLPAFLTTFHPCEVEAISELLVEVGWDRPAPLI